MLNEDMISLAETPKPIVIKGDEWEKAPEWMDKNYIFKYNGTYYLSWGRDYATSKNIYGPYTCQGAVGQGHHLSEYAHGSFFNWKDQFYHIWTYYLRQGYKYRECIISYCHKTDDGEIVTDTDFLVRHFEYGVGGYDASWQQIEAEWYSEKSPGIEKHGRRDKGFYLSNLEKGSWVKFANVEFGEEQRSRKINLVFFDSRGPVSYEVRVNDLDGKVISKGAVKQEQTANNKVIVSCELEQYSGMADVYIMFTNEFNKTTKMDQFQIIEN